MKSLRAFAKKKEKKKKKKESYVISKYAI